MKLTLSNIALLVGIVLVIISCVLFISSRPDFAVGSAPSGLPATVATTSNPTVGTTASLVFATSSCSARIITTVGATTSMTFSDNQGKVPTDSFGTQQAANTTVVYDSGHFGCNALRIDSAATQVITVVETN